MYLKMLRDKLTTSRNVIVSANHLRRRWAAWTRTLGGFRVETDATGQSIKRQKGKRDGGQQVRRQLPATAGTNIPAISTPNITVSPARRGSHSGGRCPPRAAGSAAGIFLAAFVATHAKTQHLMRSCGMDTFGSHAEIRRGCDFRCTPLCPLLTFGST